MQSFWVRNITSNLYLHLQNIVDNTTITSFCANFSSLSINNPGIINCTGGNGSAMVTSNTGWASMTPIQNYETYLNAFRNSGNITRTTPIGTATAAIPPWYSSSSFCDPAHYNNGCGITASSTKYCLVTDELSGLCQDFSLSPNSSDQGYAQACLITQQLLNATQGNHGNLTEWTAIMDNSSGTPFINKSVTNDNAGDADARFIQMDFNIANNANFSNSSLKTNATTQGIATCYDFVRYDFYKTNKISLTNSSRNYTFMPAGGANVAATGPTGNDFMYSGYYGDYVLALRACAQATGNLTFDSIATDVTENLLSAANWTRTTGFRVPPGRAFKWTNSNQPSTICTTVCSPTPYIDDPDGKRLAKICGANEVYIQAGLVLHPDIQEYCNEWNNTFGGNPTQYPQEYWANWTVNGNPSSVHGSTDDRYAANGLGTWIDMSANFSNAINRQNYNGNNKFNTGTLLFSGDACFGIYSQSLVVESLGALTSTTFATTMGFAGPSICTGAGTPATYQQNGFNLTVNSPVNASNISGTYTLLNITVYNNNVTASGGSNVAGTFPQILYNDTFSSNPFTSLWSGQGSWGWSSNGGGVINDTSDSGAVAYTQNLNLTNMTKGYNISLNMSMTNFTNAKIFFGTTSGTQSGDRVLLERNGNGGTLVNIKHDGGSFASYTVNANQYVIVNIYINLTQNNITVTSPGGSRWTDSLANNHLTINGSYIAFVPGANMSLNAGLDQFGWNISDINVTNTGTPYNITTPGGAGSALMNVTFYNGLTGAFINASTGLANGTTVTFNYTGLSPGANYWYVRINSSQNNETFPNLTFTVYANSPDVLICNNTDTIIFNTTGVYNVTVYNITNGNANPVFFNASLINYNFSVNDGNNYKYLNFTTFQALLNISSYKLFLNTIINGFNATDNLQANTTTTGNLLIPANNGTNNVKIDVAGNYSLNYSFLVQNPLSTTQVNATGVYDNQYVIGAKFGNLVVTNFSINITNGSLGGQIINATTTNGTIIANLLQGYSYLVNIQPQNYTYNNVTLNTTASLQYYNFSVFNSNIINFTFYDETNNSVVTGPNITATLVSPSESAVFSTTNGTIITTVLIPDNYVIKYSAINYTTRYYLFNLTQNTYTALSLPMLLSSAATTVTITVVNTVQTPLVGAIVKVYLYDLPSNTYKINQIVTTGTGGVTTATIQLNNPFYYFTVDYQGTTRLVTQPSQIYGTTLLLTVPIGNNAFQSFTDLNNLQGTITNNTPTQYAFVYSDVDNIASQGCLYAYNLTPTSLVLYNQTCVSGSGGAVSVGVDSSNNGTYYLYGVVTKNNNQYTLDTAIASFNSPPISENTSRIFLFVMFLIMVLIIIMFSGNPPVAAVLAGFVPVLFSGANMIPVGLAYTVPVFIVSIIIAVVIDNR